MRAEKFDTDKGISTEFIAGLSVFLIIMLICSDQFHGLENKLLFACFSLILGVVAFYIGAEFGEEIGIVRGQRSAAFASLRLLNQKQQEFLERTYARIERAKNQNQLIDLECRIDQELIDNDIPPTFRILIKDQVNLKSETFAAAISSKDINHSAVKE